MPELVWDVAAERKFETGVDHGVLYPTTADGSYATGVPWNGLTTVTESPSGAESNKQYADNIVYLNLQSAEQFDFTIEAFMYPNAFGACDGTAEPEPGVALGQQPRKTFGFSYRTRIGNSIDQSLGYKLHLVYGALAAPSEKARATVNDTPEPLGFSWECSTTPVTVGVIDGKEYAPVAHLTIDSTVVDEDALATLEATLYGGTGTATLPDPADVVAIFAGA